MGITPVLWILSMEKLISFMFHEIEMGIFKHNYLNLINTTIVGSKKRLLKYTKVGCSTTLAEEYERDLAKGLDIHMPENYFPNNDVNQQPLNIWRSHTHLLFNNWLNYYAYQATPYQWS